MNQTITEKIIQAHLVDAVSHPLVKSGQTVQLRPDTVMTHDNTAAVLKKFKSAGFLTIASPQQIVFTLDHNVQDKSVKNLNKYSDIRSFAHKYGIHFYEAGRGIGHQVMIEEGYTRPGSLCVASDSHSNMYGGVGCLGTPIVRTDAAVAWVTSEIWWTIPEIIQVNFTGHLNTGVSGKDVILNLIGGIDNSIVRNKIIEFNGKGIASLTIEDRLTIANMTTEWGSLGGLFPVDAKLISWLQRNTKTVLENYSPIDADENATYSSIIDVVLSSISPVVTGPNTVDKMTSLKQLSANRIHVQKAYLVSCVNSRETDLKSAAEILKGNKVHPNVELYISAASNQVEENLEKSGHWSMLLNAGAKPLISGCGPCIGLGVGLLKDGEVGISATNRNFRGRMGSRNADVYLSSPAVVATSAINGYISGGYQSDSEMKINIHSSHVVEPSENSILVDEFSKDISGHMLLCLNDGIDTDSIYPSIYTYDESITFVEQGGLAMQNYDPDFQDYVSDGQILIGGQDFGKGSSREQAVTCLQACGIQLVIAESFSATYQRNALNNGFILLTAPQFVKYIKKQYNQFGYKSLLVMTDLKIDFQKNMIQIKGESIVYSFDPLSEIQQQLIISGGLINQTMQNMKIEGMKNNGQI